MPKRSKIVSNEKAVHRQVCAYLKAQYPHVIFTSEASGIRLTIGQAKQIKALRSSRGLPDLMIFEPVPPFKGLFIELKREGVSVTGKDEHIAEQAEVLCTLMTKGYYGDFAVGFDEAKSLIDDYMAGKILD